MRSILSVIVLSVWGITNVLSVKDLRVETDVNEFVKDHNQNRASLSNDEISAAIANIVGNQKIVAVAKDECFNPGQLGFNYYFLVKGTVGYANNFLKVSSNLEDNDDGYTFAREDLTADNLDRQAKLCATSDAVLLVANFKENPSDHVHLMLRGVSYFRALQIAEKLAKEAA